MLYSAIYTIIRVMFSPLSKHYRIIFVFNLKGEKYKIMKNDRLKKSIDLGHRLSELRISKGLTQSEFCNEFAEFTGSLQPIQISAVSSWERNHRTPTMTTLVNLALYYNVSIDYLF